LKALETADTLASHREDWEHVLRRLKAGEMPPAGIPNRLAFRP
jgi:hypothetical protein